MGASECNRRYNEVCVVSVRVCLIGFLQPFVVGNSCLVYVQQTGLQGEWLLRHTNGTLLPVQKW